MNKYLEKIASKWDSIGKYWGHVSGKTARRLGDKLHYVEESIARKETPQSIAKDLAAAKASKTKAQVITAGVAGVGLLGAGYGIKKYRDNERAKTRAQFESLFKNASMAGPAKEIGKGVLSGIGHAINRGASVVGDVLHSATSGKINAYGKKMATGTVEHPRMKPGTKQFMNFTDKYRKSNPKEKVHMLSGIQGVKSTQVRKDMSALYRDRRNARITVGATGVAGLALHKAFKKPEEEQQSYY